MRHRRVGWVLHLRGNPLSRGVDRVEAAVLAGLVALFVVTAPLLAVVAARLTGAAGVRELRTESTVQRAQATLLQNAGEGQAGFDGSVTPVLARWPDPSGGSRSGPLMAALGQRAGSRVPIWVTKNGQLAQPPLSRTEVDEQVVNAAVLSVFGLAAALSLVAAAVRLAANRRRMARWARAWALTSPGWSQLR